MTYCSVNNVCAGLNHLEKNYWSDELPEFVRTLWHTERLLSRTLDKPAIREFVLGDRSRFDVVIVENFFNEYGAPVVQLLSFATNPRVSQWHGNPYDPSHLADLFSGYAAPMTFAERAINTVSAAFNTWVYRLVCFPQHRAAIREHFAYDGHRDRPDLETMLRDHVSLTLVNSHPLLGPVAPFVPSYVQVAGMHVQPAKTLPEVRVT